MSMSKYTVRRITLVGVMAASALAGASVAATTSADEPATSLLILPTPAPAISAVELPPCLQEDGPGPCIWKADKRGNGTGYSFWIDCEQFVHYESAKVQRRMDPIVNRPDVKAYDSTC